MQQYTDYAKDTLLRFIDGTIVHGVASVDGVLHEVPIYATRTTEDGRLIKYIRIDSDETDNGLVEFAYLVDATGGSWVRTDINYNRGMQSLTIAFPFDLKVMAAEKAKIYVGGKEIDQSTI